MGSVDILAIIMSAIGLVLLLTGICFLIPYKSVDTMDSETEGMIVDMCKNQISFNHAYAEKLSSEHERRTARKTIKTISVGSGTGDNPFTAHQVYAYTVSGVPYKRAENVAFDIFTIQKNMGRTVTVYYKSDDPFVSSLSNGKIYKNLNVGLCAGGLCLCIAALILVVI